MSPRSGYDHYAAGVVEGSVTDYAFRRAASAASNGVRVLILCLRGLDAHACLARVSPPARDHIELVIPAAGRLASEESSRVRRAFGPDEVSMQFSPLAFRTGRLIYPLLAAVGDLLRPYPLFLTVHEPVNQVGVPTSARSFTLAQ